MFEKIKGALAVCSILAVGVGAAVLPGTPAAAQYNGYFIHLTSPYDVSYWEPGGCHIGYFCAWRSTSGNGGGIGFYYDKWDWSASDVPLVYGRYSIDNDSESWWNHGTPAYNNDVQMYQYAGGSGASYCVQNGVQIWSGNPGGLRNAVSAHVWRSSC